MPFFRRICGGLLGALLGLGSFTLCGQTLTLLPPLVGETDVDLSWHPATNSVVVSVITNALGTGPDWQTTIYTNGSASVSFPGGLPDRAFFALRSVSVLHFPESSLEDAVRAQIPIKYSPTNDVYDIEVENIPVFSAAVLGLSDLGPLSSFVGTTNLVLFFNNISDLSPLAGLTNLVALDIQGNFVDDLSPLAGLLALRELYAAMNLIDDLMPLQSLTALEVLDLRSNFVDDLSPLAAATGLKILNLGGNPDITNIAPLTNFPLLEEVDLSGTGVTNTTSLANLLHLQEVNLNNTAITNLAPFIANAQAGGLGTGDRLFIEEVPIADTNQITVLRSTYGVSVFYSPPSGP